MYIIACIKDHKNYSTMWALKVVIVMIAFLFVFDLFTMFLVSIGDVEAFFPCCKFVAGFIKWIFVGL